MTTALDVSTLSGKTLYGPDHEKIGKIADVYASVDDGHPTFATVSTGLFGRSASFFPLSDLTVQGDDAVLPYGKDKVKDAPRVDDDAELSPQDEQELYRYYGVTTGATTGTAAATAPVAQAGTTQQADIDLTDTATRSAGHDTSGPNTDDAMTRSEERLTVGTTTSEAGRARLRKFVVSEDVTQTVPVSHEEIRIEREPITESNVGDAYRGADLTEEEHEVVLTQETPVVQKETVPVERVRLGTETVTEQARVDETLRHEEIVTEGDTTGTTGTTGTAGTTGISGDTDTPR